MKTRKKLVFIVLAITLFLTLIGCSKKSNPTNNANTDQEKIRILCFGDSNTWGCIPVEKIIPSTRYSSDIRWTGILQKQLGDSYQIIEDGLCGRIAGVDDFSNGLEEPLNKELNLNGRAHLLSSLKSQSPIDLIVIMLGTNDLRYDLNQTSDEIAMSMKNLVLMVNNSVNKQTEWLAYDKPKVLIVTPVPIKEGKHALMNKFFKDGYEKSTELGILYDKVAKDTGADFFDAATVIPVVNGVDGIHLNEKDHKVLGEALASKITDILKK
jgi:lysophospholipase L1-like esterase